MEIQKLRIGTLVVALALVMGGGQAQDVINLNNPSFEDTPRAGGLGSNKPIKGWYDCGLTAYPDQSPPDIHPHDEAWMVSVGAYEGKTFLGLVVRDDASESHEFISQALEVAIKEGQCYDFSIYLAQSDTYMGLRNYGIYDSVTFSRPFMTPAVLRIWGGKSICSKDELLGTSGPVENKDWKEFAFRFEPELSHRYITLEAFYVTPVLSAYNGHILVDQASAIVQVVCDEEVPALVISEPKPEDEQDIVSEERDYNKSPRETQSTPPPPVDVESVEEEQPVVYEPRIMRDLNRKYITSGQTIRIDRLSFPADSTRLQKESYAVLNEIRDFLVSYPDVVVEIGGHTNTKPEDWYCDQLSEARAKAVTDYLIDNGVPEDQVQYKGYGKRKPIIPDDRYSSAAQRKNQRVEIKILSLNG